MPIGGQTLPVNSALSNWIAALGKRLGPGGKEHDLGGNEKDHAVAVANLNHPGVKSHVHRFLCDIAPP